MRRKKKRAKFRSFRDVAIEVVIACGEEGGPKVWVESDREMSVD